VGNGSFVHPFSFWYIKKMLFPTSRRLESVIHRMLMRRLLLPVLAAVMLVDVVAGALIWRSILQRQDALVGALANRSEQGGEQHLWRWHAWVGARCAYFLDEAVPQFSGLLTDAQKCRWGWLRWMSDT
jgi:hypothetical protein